MLHIYKASAGSGKTYALTRQYLKLLLGYQDGDGKWILREKPNGANRHILAITFTNKATEEMTTRIISELAVLAGREPGKTGKSAYLDEFIKLFGTDEPTLRELASETLDDLLADYVFFHVSTIDSFFQNVLRIFAREIEMPDNFDLEIDDKRSIMIGVNSILESIKLKDTGDPVVDNERKWISKWLQNYMIRLVDEGNAANLFSRSSHLFKDLVGDFSRYLNETFRINSAEISEYLKNPQRIEAFEKALYSHADDAKAELAAKAKVLMQYGDYDQINHNVRKKIADASEGIFSKKLGNSVPGAIADLSKRYSKKYYEICIKNGFPGDFDDRVFEMIVGLNTLYNERDRDNKIIKALSAFGLIGCLLNAIERHCKDNNLILLSDTNTLLQGIINDDDTPFIYERLGYYLHHFLIDEFQDTSRMQWDNLKPLIMESLSRRHENLVIGDEKQCIYRFRNSDPQLLATGIYEDITKKYDKDSVKVEGTKLEQNNNWRSSREVVTFNNSFFFALGAIIGDKSYEKVIQQISEKRTKKVDGHVLLIVQPELDAAKKGGKKASEASDTEADAPISSDEAKKLANEFALDQTEKQVERLLDAGYRFSDIAILVRTHNEGINVIRRLLDFRYNDKPVEVASDDTIYVSESPSVKMIIEILRLTLIPQVVKKELPGRKPTTVINPAFKRTRLLYCYEYYLHKPVEEPDGTTRAATPAEALSMALDTLRESESQDGALGKLDEQVLAGHSAEIEEMLNFERRQLLGEAEGANTAPATTLSTIVDRIVERFILPEARRKDTAFITAFQDIVYDFCSHGNSDIRSFLEMWDQRGRYTSIISGDENSAIRVMTIHQSKGLEFPCVIIPFGNRKFVNYDSMYKRSTFWFELKKEYFPGINDALIPPMIPLDFDKSLGEIDAFKEQFECRKHEQLVDELNSTYVAFTRAVNELVVISPFNDADESLYRYIQTITSSLTSEYIAENKILDDDTRAWVHPLADLYNPATGILEIGTPTVRKPEPKADADKKAEAAADEPETYELPDYDPTVNDSLTMLTELDSKFFDFDSPRHRGDFLHGVLSRVRRADELDSRLRRAARRARLTEEQTAECAALLSGALADERVRPWFEGFERVVRERPVAHGGEVSRPDRVVWTADGHIDVVDFKFGEPENEHRTQVAHYADLLRRAGLAGVRAFLWYIPAGEIVQVD